MSPQVVKFVKANGDEFVRPVAKLKPWIVLAYPIRAAPALKPGRMRREHVAFALAEKPMGGPIYIETSREIIDEPTVAPSSPPPPQPLPNKPRSRA